MGKRTRKTKRKPKPKVRTITIPKTKPRGRPKGFSKLTRCQNKDQAVYGFAITFSPSYKKAHGSIVNVKGEGRMREYRAERLFLQRAYGITPRKTSPQRL